MSNYNNPMNNNMNTDPNTLKNASKVTDLKPDGEQNNKRNLIIIAVIIALIVFGIYFKGRKANDTDVVNEEIDTEIPVIDEEDVVIKDDKALSPKVDSTVKIVDENKAKFDLALSNGSKAFLDGSYVQALAFYNEALSYRDSDVVYVRLSTVYGMQGEWVKALESINKAINLNPSYTDYWNTKILIMDQRTNASYAELEAVYKDGLIKVDSRTKINLITNFAQVTEAQGLITQAIDLWKTAQKEFPANNAIYQAEIDRLTKTIQ